MAEHDMHGYQLPEDVAEDNKQCSWPHPEIDNDT